jgi:hypothetical protein
MTAKTSEAEAHLAERKPYLRGDTEHVGVSDIPRRQWRTNSSQKKTQFRSNVNLNKEQCVKGTPPLNNRSTKFTY